MIYSGYCGQGERAGSQVRPLPRLGGAKVPCFTVGIVASAKSATMSKAWRSKGPMFYSGYCVSAKSAAITKAWWSKCPMFVQWVVWSARYGLRNKRDHAQSWWTSPTDGACNLPPLSGYAARSWPRPLQADSWHVTHQHTTLIRRLVLEDQAPHTGVSRSAARQLAATDLTYQQTTLIRRLVLENVAPQRKAALPAAHQLAQLSPTPTDKMGATNGVAQAFALIRACSCHTLFYVVAYFVLLRASQLSPKVNLGN